MRVHFPEEFYRKNTTTTVLDTRLALRFLPGSLSLVGRCYGRRRVCPTVSLTHSLSLVGARALGSHTRRTRTRPDQLGSHLRIRTRRSFALISYQCPVLSSTDIFLESRTIGCLAVPMTISDLETNDRSTNNGYAFFRDVPNGPVPLFLEHDLSIHSPRYAAKPNSAELTRSNNRQF